MGIPGCCNGVHHWYAATSDTSHNQRAVSCRDYVNALEQLVQELGGEPELALLSCMAGASGELPATHAGIPVVARDEEVSAPPCSRCRTNPPREGGPWCYPCYDKLVEEMSGNNDN